MDYNKNNFEELRKLAEETGEAVITAVQAKEEEIDFSKIDFSSWEKFYDMPVISITRSFDGPKTIKIKR